MWERVPADPMTSIWGGGGNVANPYGNLYFHTSECKALRSLPPSSPILFWLRVAGQKELVSFALLSHPKSNTQPKPGREGAGTVVLAPTAWEGGHTWDRKEGRGQSVLTWLLLSEICFSISWTICLNVGLFRGSASQQVFIMSYLQNEGHTPSPLSAHHWSSGARSVSTPKITPGLGAWTHWHTLGMKCCRNPLCIWWQERRKISYRNDIWPRS